ncbi:hypothetical protein ABZ920_11955 [Streptomyces sp. NPDC046831]|uniref:hypothetical protein n=1 Tax=Streptomyces sp. NPDC046831 TaxID=3154805 RepID=UPI0033CD7550
MSEPLHSGGGRLQHTGETAKEQASATAGQAKQAAGQVAQTAAEQARAVAGEVRQQAGTVLDEVRGRAMSEVEGQTRRAAGALRQWSDDVAGLAENAQSDSPARSLATQVAESGHRAADYLEKQGVEGMVSDLRGFARRRPGAFLGGALLAGLAAGRLAKAAGKAGQSQTASRPSRPQALDEAATSAPASGAVYELQPPALPTPPTPPPPAAPPQVQTPPPPAAPPQVPPPVSPPPAGPATRPFPEV